MHKLTALALALPLLAGACGNDSDTADASAPTTTAPTAPANDTDAVQDIACATVGPIFGLDCP